MTVYYVMCMWVKPQQESPACVQLPISSLQRSKLIMEALPHLLGAVGKLTIKTTASSETQAKCKEEAC